MRLGAIILAAGAAASPAGASVDVSLSGPAEAGYEVVVYGARRVGMLAGGRAAESIEVSERDISVPAAATFRRGPEVLAVCPPVTVLIEAGQASCAPSFALLEPRAGQGWTCEARCPARAGGRSDEDDDEEETVVGMLWPRAD